MWRYSCALLAGLSEQCLKGEKGFSFRVFLPPDHRFREMAEEAVREAKEYFEILQYEERSRSRFVNLFLDTFAALPDAEISHGTSNWMPTRGGGKRIVTVHDLFQPYPVSPPASIRAKFRSWYYRRRFQKDAQFWDAIITDRGGTVPEIQERLSFNRPVQVFSPPLDPVFLSSNSIEGEEGDTLEDPFLLAFASLDTRKNIGAVIRAMPLLKNRLRLLVVCQNEEVERRVTLEAAKLLKEGDLCVETVSALPLKPLRSLYARSEVLVFPSLAEGFGYPIFEALSQGTPVVASNDLVHESLARPLKPLLYGVSPSDPNEIAKAVDRALLKKPSREECEVIISLLKERLSPAPHAQKMLQFYRSMTGEGASVS